MADGDIDIGAMLKSAMSDPRFGEILSTLAEKKAQGQLDLDALKGIVPPEAAEAVKKLGSDGKTPHFSDHKKLLAALRPYLSDNKRETVDSILKIGAVGEIAEKLVKQDK